MRERPILFSGEMVRAILAGRKTETRRVAAPRVDPGDRLWVRETWRAVWAEEDLAAIDYRADGLTLTREILGEYLGPDEVDEWRDRWVLRGGGAWQPSIFMPRWASRLLLRVEEVRVERLQAIRWHDIRAEGVSCPTHDFSAGFCTGECADLRAEWVRLWDSINGRRPGCAWKDDPWVWVVRFSRVRP